MGRVGTRATVGALAIPAAAVMPDPSAKCPTSTDDTGFQSAGRHVVIAPA